MIGDDVVHSSRYLRFGGNKRHEARSRMYAVAQKGTIGANREPAKIPLRPQLLLLK
jgi:hypothetical protein